MRPWLVRSEQRFTDNFMRFPMFLALVPLALAPAASARELQAFQRPALRQAIAKLTHDAIWAHVKHLPPPSADLGAPAGVFVTISRAGVTRGCWGSVAPRTASLGAELAATAVKALSHDYRQPPIQPRELAGLVAHVSIVGELEPVEGADALQPRKFGLLVSGNGKGGVLLPGEAATATWQVATCRRKAGLRPRERARLYRFETAVVGPIPLAE
jgi:AMMECR1 domain-containing protein